MKRRNGFEIALLWVVLAACIVGAALTLLSSADGFLGVRLVRGEDYEIIARYARLRRYGEHSMRNTIRRWTMTSSSKARSRV